MLSAMSCVRLAVFEFASVPAILGGAQIAALSGAKLRMS